MDRDEKLAMARRKLKQFQARNSPQSSLSDAGQPAVSQSFKSPIPAPTLAGALPFPGTLSLFNGLSPSVPTLSSSGPPPSFPAGLTLSPPSSQLSSTGATPALPPPSISSSAPLGPFTPSLDLAPPLTSTTLNSSTNYSLPNLVGKASSTGNTARPLSEQARLNGSIVEHLSPRSEVIPPVGVKTQPSFTSSDRPPPYGGSTPGMVPLGSATEVSSVPLKALSLPSGASHGGVLLKHIPYLPSGGSVGVESEAGLEGAGLAVPDTWNGSENSGDGGTGSEVMMASRGEASVMGEEVSELEQKVRAHAQTIDILVSEKSTLQMELASLKTQLSKKSRERQEWESHAKGSQKKLADLERELHAATSELAGRREAKSESAELRKTLERLRASLEEQQEESTELISRVTAQSAEIVQLQDANTELQGKLNMAELLTQQLSGGKPVETTPTDPALLSRLQEAEGQVKQLKRGVEMAAREKEQVDSDLSVLRDSMVQHREESKRKLKELQTEQAEREAKISSMKSEMRELALQKEELEQRLSTEHAQSEHSSSVAMESIQQEGEQLKAQLEKQVQENIQLVKTNTELESQALEAELRASRLEEQSIDHQTLLTTMAQDKETLSRAMSQNKELKHNMAELQDAFVKLSNQNMELASELDTERRRVAYLKTQLATLAPVTETAPIPVVDVESVSVRPAHVGSNLVEGMPTSAPTSAQTTVLPLATSSTQAALTESSPQATLTEEAGYEEVEAETGRSEQEALALENSQLREQLKQLRLQYSTLQDLQQRGLIQHVPPSAEIPPSEPSRDADLQHQQQEGVLTTPSETSKDPILQEQRFTGNAPPIAEITLSEPSQAEQEGEEQIDNGSKDDKSRGDDMAPPDVDHTHSLPGHTHPMSPGQLVQLQTSFDALQHKFVSLMREKADLLDKVQEHEVVITKLASETETIGDYIALYQTQREALKTKFQEKDNFIQQLISEKSAMQANIGQLQILVRRVLSGRTIPQAQPAVTPVPSRVSAPHISTPVRPTQPLHADSAIPIHLRPQVQLEADVEELEAEYADMEGGESFDVGIQSSDSLLGVHDPGRVTDDSHVTEEDSHVTKQEDSYVTEDISHMTEEDSYTTTSTAEQIMELLDQLESTTNLHETAGSGGVVVQCKHCTGELQAV